MIKSWINARMKERTSWDGAMLVALGLMVLFLATSKDCGWRGYYIRRLDYPEKRLTVRSNIDPAGKFNNLRCSTPLR